MIARFLVLAALQPALAVQDKGAQDEYKVKADLLFAVAAHITWPEKAFEKADSPLRLGLLGTDRFGKVFDSIKDSKFRGRPIEIQREADAEKLKTCHIVFVCDSESEKLDGVLKTFAGSSTLLLGDKEGFGKRGVAVNFFLEEQEDGSKETRWELNLDALERAGLNPSAKLRSLGRKPK